MYSKEWFQGDCPICGQEKHVREFPAFGILCVDCYFAKGSRMRHAGRKSRYKNPVARLSYGTVRRLGSVTRSVSDGFLGVGTFIKGVPRVLTSGSRARKRSPPEGAPLLSREAIRSMVVEELTRMRGVAESTAAPELDERLRLMAAAIQALQERIDKLGAAGSIIGEATMWKEVGSLEAAESLTDDERVLLVNVFRQNVAIQKPELASAGGDGGR